MKSVSKKGKDFVGLLNEDRTWAATARLATNLCPTWAALSQTSQINPMLVRTYRFLNAHARLLTSAMSARCWSAGPVQGLWLLQHRCCCFANCNTWLLTCLKASAHASFHAILTPVMSACCWSAVLVQGLWPLHHQRCCLANCNAWLLACLKHLRTPHFMQYLLQQCQRVVGLQGFSKGFGSVSADVIVVQTAPRDYKLVLKHLRAPLFVKYSLQRCQRSVSLKGLSKGFGSFIADAVIAQTAKRNS